MGFAIAPGSAAITLWISATTAAPSPTAAATRLVVKEASGAGFMADADG